MPRSGNVEKYYSEKEGKIPTKESHNGDKHATITKLVIFIVNIVQNYSCAIECHCLILWIFDRLFPFPVILNKFSMASTSVRPKPRSNFSIGIGAKTICLFFVKSQRSFLDFCHLTIFFQTCLGDFA